MKKGIRKALSVLLSMALVVTGMGVTAYAEEPAPGTGLCEHHTEHDESCGYVEAVPGHECEHVHTDACYEEVEVASPPEASPSEATPANGTKKKVLVCSHAVEGQHDSECGYVEAVEGKPCLFKCDQCGTIPYMDADGTMHYEKVGLENIVQVDGKNYEWTNPTGTERWYYLKDSQVFNEQRIKVLEGDVKLVLGRGATLTARHGICVAEGASLTIYGQSMTDGTLKAYMGGFAAAAIGGGASGITATSGEITINSGSVYAGPSGGEELKTSILGSAGIGAGSGGLGSVITINGGYVNAKGIGAGPGIGGGSDGSHIIINGGTVEAVGGTAVIGAVVGGDVIAGGAGIGGGETSPAGTVEINGGTVTAAGGKDASGIGAGTRGSAGSVTIGGGAKVTARGDRSAIEADLSFDGVYDGDYVVTANEQNEAGGVVAELRVGDDYRKLSASTAGYRYLKAEPRTLKAVTINPRSASVDIGQTILFSVMTADDTYPAADATEILKTSWGLSSGNAGYQPAAGTTLTGGLLNIAGDEKVEKLTVSAVCDLPEGVTMAENTANVTVHQAKYTVSFDANGGHTDAAPMLTTMGRLETLPQASRTGYTFVGWYRNRPADGAADTSAQVDGNTVYTQDTTLYAGWRVNQYTVTYYSMGGNPAVFTRTVVYGGHVPKPAVPVKELSVFEGWYTDPGYTNRWDFDRGIVTGDMQLYAKWADEVLDVTVSAEALPVRGGSVLYAGSYRSGSMVTLEAVPAAGYQFVRWTKDGKTVSTSARYQFVADEDTALKAEFEWVGIPEESGSGSGSGHSGGSSSGSSHSGGSGSSGSSGSFGGGSSGGYSGGSSGSGSGGGSRGGSGGGGLGSGASGGAAGTAQGGPIGAVSVPTVVPGSGEAISTVVAVADAAAVNVANAQSASGAWVQNEQGWMLQVDGKAAANSWVCVAEKDGAHWYHFGTTGLMDTGWLELDGKKYYLHADHDGTAGRMLTGWQLLDGKWYYFSSASDATLGTLLTNTVTPDGYRVNAQGEWIQ